MSEQQSLQIVFISGVFASGADGIWRAVIEAIEERFEIEVAKFPWSRWHKHYRVVINADIIVCHFTAEDAADRNRREFPVALTVPVVVIVEQDSLDEYFPTKGYPAMKLPVTGTEVCERIEQLLKGDTDVTVGS